MAKEKINVKDRDIVVPGQILAEGMDFLPSGKAIRSNGNIIASTMGLVSIKGRVLKVIPLAGKYAPKKNDTVIGEVTEMGSHGWKVDIGTAQESEINLRDASTSFIDQNNMSRVYEIGDTVLANIIELPPGRYIKLSTKFRPNGKLNGGIVTEVSPSKIPRMIGREGSMIRLLKDGSKCDIFVGQNGLVWIRGEPKDITLASKAIKMICTKSHTNGLTEEIKALLDGKSKNKTKKASKPAKGGKSSK